jgi:hypothetical protein
VKSQAREEARKLASAIGRYMERRHGARQLPMDKMQINPRAAAIFDFDLDKPQKETP